MAIGDIEVGQELLNVPMGEMIRSMAMAIADSQVQLDKASAATAEMMSGTPDGTKVSFGAEQVSMMELGFTPTFYQFIDTIIEVKISITMTRSRQLDVKGKATPKAEAVPVVATVSAGYSSKYSYSVEGSSLLRTKLVPVPPPGILEERIRALMEK